MHFSGTGTKKNVLLFVEIMDYINNGRQQGKIWVLNDRGHQCSYLACA
jgi:hypothetical protein